MAKAEENLYIFSKLSDPRKTNFKVKKSGHKQEQQRLTIIG